MIRRAILLAILSVQSVSPATIKSIEGAWKVAVVETIKADGTKTSAFPVESQVLFTGKYYSFCWNNIKSSAATWAMSDSVKIGRINSSLINAGTYELQGDLLNMKADFAMNPKFVGGTASYSVTMKEDTLVLSGTNVIAADNMQNPAYAAGSRFITKLVHMKP